MKKERYIYPVFHETENILRGLIVKIRYYDENDKPKTHTKYFNLNEYENEKYMFKAAISHRNEMLVKAEQKKITEKTDFTVRQVFVESLKVFTARLATLNKRIKRYNTYILPKFDNINIQKVKRVDVQLSLNSMIRDCSDDTIANVYQIWCLIFKTARIMQLIDVNVMEEIIKPKSQKITLKRNVKTDFDTFLKVIVALNAHVDEREQYQRFNKLLIYGLWIMLYTGLRPAETFALERKNIDTTSWIIIVDKSLGSDTEQLNVKRATKTKDSMRIIPIAKELRPIILELLDYAESNELFSINGELFKVKSATDKITRVCRLEGINFTMYMLRHKFSTDLVTNNVDPRTVMELMGHCDPKMTIGYARSDLALKEEVLKDRKI